jgi:hypothetical protein
LSESSFCFDLLAHFQDNPYNLAELTSADYPVVFNIIFWFSFVFIFSLLAISLALSNVEDRGEFKPIDSQELELISLEFQTA